MTCPTCGALIPADAGFCRGCGTIVRGPRLRTAPDPATTSIPYPPPPRPPPPGTPASCRAGGLPCQCEWP
jgi:hypothetical protein